HRALGGPAHPAQKLNDRDDLGQLRARNHRAGSVEDDVRGLASHLGWEMLPPLAAHPIRQTFGNPHSPPPRSLSAYRIELHRPEDLRPLRYVRLDQRAELRRCAAARLRSAADEALPYRTLGHDLRDLAAEDADDGLRQARGPQHAAPLDDLIARNAAFIHRRNIGRNRRAPGSRDSKSPEASGIYVRQRFEDVDETSLHVPAHQI